MVMLKHRQSAFEGYRGLLGTDRFRTPAWDLTREADPGHSRPAAGNVAGICEPRQQAVKCLLSMSGTAVLRSLLRASASLSLVTLSALGRESNCCNHCV